MKYPTYSLGVGAFCHSKEKHILLVRHQKTPHVWTIPSGYRLPSESIFTTAERETYEETGLTITPYGLIGTRLRLDDEANIWVIVAAEIRQATITMDSQEIAETHLFSKRQVDQLPLTPFTKALMNGWLNERLHIWQPSQDVKSTSEEFYC